MIIKHWLTALLADIADVAFWLAFACMIVVLVLS